MARAYAYARPAVALAVALLCVLAAASPATAQSAISSYEWGEARRDAPRYLLRRVELDGTTIAQQDTITWPSITVASWQSNRVSSMAATVSNGNVILYRASRHSIYRIAGSSQTIVAGLGQDLYSPSVALIDGALYQANVYGIGIPVRRIANIAGGNTSVEVLNPGGPDTDNGNNPKGTWIGHGKVWACYSGGVYSWQLPTTIVSGLAGRISYTRPTQMTCTVSAVPSFVPIDNGRFLMQQGGNIYLWNPTDGSVARLATDNADTLQSIFPTPFDDSSYFTGASPTLSNIDTQLGGIDEQGNRTITVRLNWQSIPGSTGYQIERNGALFRTIEGDLQETAYEVVLPAGVDFDEEEIRMRAILDGGANGGTVTIGATTIRLAPGERRYSPWTGRYEYALLGKGYTLTSATGDELPPSRESLPAVKEGVQLISAVFGLSYTQSSFLAPMLNLVFSSILPAMMIAAVPRSPIMLWAALTLGNLTWIFAGWLWFGLPLPMLGLPPVIVTALGIGIGKQISKA